MNSSHLRLLAWLLPLCVVACSKANPEPVEAAAPVTVAAAKKASVPDLVNAVGSVEAINSVAVKSLIDGQLLESHVKDGDEVSVGELLFHIDPRPAQAALLQTQAAQAKDEAARELASAQVKRYEPVAAKGFISADQMQQYITAASAAAASVKVDQANVAASKLTLAYTDIRAPIAGRAGRVLVQPGNLVKANDTNSLLVINQISPIYVNFAIPGNLVDRVRSAKAKATLAVSASGDGMAKAQIGTLAFVDNAVDPSTNTVKLRAQFDNADEVLWPGQFITISLTLATDADAIVIPDNAVKAGPNGNYVFVLNSDGHVKQQDVTIARSVDGQSLVSKGINAGENVVTDGQSRLVDGGKAKVSETKK